MASEVEVIVTARTESIGTFSVRRSLPSVRRRMVGPFTFLDHMGPASARMNVLPHPHIGIATLTYLFDGKVLHRDSLGNTQAIRPQEVNWMVSGRGIAHSERTEAEQMSSTAFRPGSRCRKRMKKRIQASATSTPASCRCSMTMVSTRGCSPAPRMVW